MSAGQKKRMHTVPRSYLEAFAVVDPTRRSPGIWRFDRNGAFKVVGLDQAEVVKHFYTVFRDVCQLSLQDRPDLVVIQVCITSARRSYEIADTCRRRGIFVALGGLHVTSLPEEAAAHADAIFTGPGEDTWPVFSVITAPERT